MEKEVKPEIGPKKEDLIAALKSENIPEEYHMMAIEFLENENIPCFIIVDKFKRWMKYATEDAHEALKELETKTFRNFDRLLLKYTREALTPHKIIDNDVIKIGEIITLEDIIKFPHLDLLCQTIQYARLNNDDRLFVIYDTSKSIQDSFKFIFAIKSKDGKVRYCDSNGIIMTESETNEFEKYLLTELFN